MSRKIKRPIEAIAEQLQGAMKREASDIVAIGDLLLEAQEQLDHGKWLPWLKENFGSSVQTAENYMSAARLAAKNPNVVNLKMRPTAMYMLGRELDNPTGSFSPKVIKAILKAAETEWVNADRAREIAASLQPPSPPPKTAEEIAAERAAADAEWRAEREAEWATDDAAEQAEQAEAETLADSPPPNLPATQEATLHDVVGPAFDQAVTALLRLQTKPSSKFVATAHRPGKIRDIADFLHMVADAVEAAPEKAPS